MKKVELKIGAILISYNNGIEVLLKKEKNNLGDGIWYSTETLKFSGRGETEVSIDEYGKILDYVNDDYFLVTNGPSNRTFCS